MNIDDLFKIESENINTMEQGEFFNKTKDLLSIIDKIYSQAWKSKVLTDDEYPQESVCDKCKGGGVFMEEGEEKECIMNNEYGECFHRFCDYEEVGVELENIIDKIYILLCVDEIKTNPKEGE